MLRLMGFPFALISLMLLRPDAHPRPNAFFYQSEALSQSVGWEGSKLVFEGTNGRKRFDPSTGSSESAPGSAIDTPLGDTIFRDPPERGRQFDTVESPNHKLRATSRERNIAVQDVAAGTSRAITLDGSVAGRIKNGTASWVYGEELSQIDAMWWSPDSSKLAYYRFDESSVKDYYVLEQQLTFQDELNTEAFPKPGKPNPIAELYVYDSATTHSTKIETKTPSELGPGMGEYVYGVQWSPDGAELLYFRMNREQTRQELMAANPVSGQSRVVFALKADHGWIDARPTGDWPSKIPELLWIDSHRFLFIEDLDGYRNIDLYDLTSGKLVQKVTHGKVDVRRIHRYDPAKKEIWYTAQGEENPYLVQLHRIRLDGSGDQTLTDPKLSHLVSVAPDGSGFADLAQNATTPQSLRYCDAGGAVKATLASLPQRPLRSERFTCLAADGVTTIYGYLVKPAGFDPNRRYPLLVNVYGGPDAGLGNEIYQPLFELTNQSDFLVAWIDGRGSTARGRDFRQALWRHCGGPEIDDQAAGARALAKRPYVDPQRVGVFGTSYGGYATLLCVLRYPDVFRAGASCSPVTDFRGYDTIYTERYLGVPPATEGIYRAGAPLEMATKLKRPLFLYFGSSDNNVHNSHFLQFYNRVSATRYDVELAIGVDEGHGSASDELQLRFFRRKFGMGK